MICIIASLRDGEKDVFHSKLIWTVIYSGGFSNAKGVKVMNKKDFLIVILFIIIFMLLDIITKVI